MDKTITYPLQIGPTHPAFKEPVRFSFKVEGERVAGVDIDLGYTHRAIEVISKERNFIQTIYLLERICGICSVSHPMAYCMAVEDASGIEIPPRARYIRTIIGELERMHSHLLWAGVAAHEIGFDTLFLYTWNIREKVLDCLEQFTGNRVNYAMLTIGGVRRDLTDDLIPVIGERRKYFWMIRVYVTGVMEQEFSPMNRRWHCARLVPQPVLPALPRMCVLIIPCLPILIWTG